MQSVLVILVSLPFALTGGVFALKLAGIPLSVSAVIGFIALLGQVSLMGLLPMAISTTVGSEIPVPLRSSS